MGLVNNSLCTTVQLYLNDYVSRMSAPELVLLRTKRGFLDALRSGMNMAGAPEITDASFSENSKNTTLRLRYWPAAARNSASGTPTDVCAAGPISVPKSQDYTISGYAQATETFAWSDFRDYCEDKNAVMSKRLLDMMFLVENKMNKDLGAALSTEVLPYANNIAVDSNIAPQTVNLFANYAAKQISLAGQLDIANEFSLADFDGTPIVVGRGKLWEYSKLAEIGCCNDVGQDLGRLSEFAGMGGIFDYFEDKDLGVTLANTDDFYAWQPGAVQLLSAQKNLGRWVYNDGLYVSNGTIVNPITGVRHDVFFRRDDCGVNGEVSQHVLIKNNYGLFVWPNDVYDAADALNTYKGAVRFRAGTIA